MFARAELVNIALNMNIIIVVIKQHQHREKWIKAVCEGEAGRPHINMRAILKPFPAQWSDRHLLGVTNTNTAERGKMGISSGVE